MNKLAKLIETMSRDDLLRLQKDFEKGTLHNLLHKQLESHVNNRIVLCPVCSTPVKEGEGYHLQFGNKGQLRKKATFDGIDCLQYFLNNIQNK